MDQCNICRAVYALFAWSLLAAAPLHVRCQRSSNTCNSASENGYCVNPDAVGSQCEAADFPLQFSASVTITAHRLDSEQEYPPAERRFQVWYNQPAGRFRVEVLHSTETVIRRFDKGYELLVTRTPGSVQCSQSKLGGEAMQLPQWPAKAVLEGETTVLGRACKHWREEQDGQVLDIFVEANTGIPVMTQASTWEAGEAGPVLVADISYSMSNVKLGPPPVEVFDIPKDVTGGLASCESVPSNIGFPYVHFLHYLYRA
mmetsp:Transcript_23120/g.64229  ORF Transcript_23120/g.64229 Transcript_23120/m.64229 type:complete len:258 (-) Transcript_23120:75-848(-)